MADHTELKAVLESIPGVTAAYFQPPPTIQLEYPCIIYERSDIRIDHANNLPYKHKKRYSVTVIDRSPISTIPDQVSMLESCAFIRHYVSDGLHHDVFSLYF